MTSTDPEPPEYLEDPEGELAIWGEEIWAEGESAARQYCQNIAKDKRYRLMEVLPLGRSGKRWRCVFRSYEAVEENDNSNSNEE